jgi:hypothetical protein
MRRDLFGSSGRREARARAALDGEGDDVEMMVVVMWYVWEMLLLERESEGFEEAVVAPLAPPLPLLPPSTRPPPTLKLLLFL